MNIFQRASLAVKTFFAPLQVMIKSLPISNSWIAQSFMAPSWSNAVKLGIKESAPVFSVMKLLVDTLLEPRMLLYDSFSKDKTEIEFSDLSAILMRPNPFQSQAQFLELLWTQLLAGGAVYIWKERDRKTKKIVGLWPFSVGQITAVPGQTTARGFIDHYEVDLGDGNKRAISTNDMFHIFYFTDPKEPHKPISPITAAAKIIDMDSELITYAFSSLKNGAIPGVVVKTAEGEIVDKETADRLREMWTQQFGGENRGGVAFLQAGMEAMVVGAKLGELDLSSIARIPESRISAVFRVPPILVGLYVGLEKSSYANFEMALRALTELTLVPTWRKVSDIFSFALVKEFYDDYKINVQFDIDSVRAFEESQDAVTTRMTAAFQAGLIDRATAKNALRLPTIPEDENFFVLGSGYKVVDATGADLYPMTLPTLPSSTETPPKGHNHPAEEKFVGPRLEGKLSKRDVAYYVDLKRTIRLVNANRMQLNVQKYFADLSARVVGRLVDLYKGAEFISERKVSAEELLSEEDGEELIRLIKSHYRELLIATWDIDNVMLGTTASLDLLDPAITKLMDVAGTRVVAITETTLKKLREVLRIGAENGWSVDHLIRGDSEMSVPGIRDVVAQTYKNRAENIARTELGTAQNVATADRYAALGVEKVLILDGGTMDSDEDCNNLNETIQTLEWFQDNPLGHPRCVRAAGAWFD